MTQPHYIDLKPCPFCGSSQLTVDEWATWYVRCEGCGVQRIGVSKTRAIENWNFRHAPMEAVSPAYCQKCGGEIQGWTCQGCGQVFRENDAGALVFAPMEAVAWREKVRLSAQSGVVAWLAPYKQEYRAPHDRLCDLITDTILQALAVIPTQPDALPGDMRGRIVAALVAMNSWRMAGVNDVADAILALIQTERAG
jgi:hypothetical protein